MKKTSIKDLKTGDAIFIFHPRINNLHFILLGVAQHPKAPQWVTLILLGSDREIKYYDVHKVGEWVWRWEESVSV